MRIRRLLLVLIYAMSFAFTAHSAEALRSATDVPESMRPLLPTTPRMPALDFVLRFNELGRLAGLSHTVTSDPSAPVADFQFAAMDTNRSKAILSRLDLRASDHWVWQLFRHKDGYFIQMPIGSQQTSVFFSGFQESEIITVLKSYREHYARESATSPEIIAFSFLDLSILPAARASEVSERAEAKNKEAGILAEIDRYNFAFGAEFRKCLAAARDGFNAATVDPFLHAGRGLTSRENFSTAWSNTIQQLKAIWAWMDKFEAGSSTSFFGKSRTPKRPTCFVTLSLEVEALEVSPIN